VLSNTISNIYAGKYVFRDLTNNVCVDNGPGASPSNVFTGPQFDIPSGLIGKYRGLHQLTQEGYYRQKQMDRGNDDSILTKNVLFPSGFSSRASYNADDKSGWNVCTIEVSETNVYRGWVNEELCFSYKELDLPANNLKAGFIGFQAHVKIQNGTDKKSEPVSGIYYRNILVRENP
jgi:hypothetical protein